MKKCIYNVGVKTDNYGMTVHPLVGSRPSSRVSLNGADFRNARPRKGGAWGLHIALGVIILGGLAFSGYITAVSSLSEEKSELRRYVAR